MMRGFHYAEIVTEFYKRFDKTQILLVKFEAMAST